MNYTPTHFLYYDSQQENKWQQATLEELTMLNDPELYVVPFYENGEQGEQCTWKEWPEKHKAFTQKKINEANDAFKKAQYEKQKKEERQRKEQEEKKKRSDEKRCLEEWATNIEFMAKLIQSLHADQLETNKKVRAVCNIFLIGIIVAAIGSLFSSLVAICNM